MERQPPRLSRLSQGSSSSGAGEGAGGSQDAPPLGFGPPAPGGGLVLQGLAPLRTQPPAARPLALCGGTPVAPATPGAGVGDPLLDRALSGLSLGLGPQPVSSPTAPAAEAAQAARAVAALRSPQRTDARLLAEAATSLAALARSCEAGAALCLAAGAVGALVPVLRLPPDCGDAVPGAAAAPQVAACQALAALAGLYRRGAWPPGVPAVQLAIADQGALPALAELLRGACLGPGTPRAAGGQRQQPGSGAHAAAGSPRSAAEAEARGRAQAALQQAAAEALAALAPHPALKDVIASPTEGAGVVPRLVRLLGASRFESVVAAALAALQGLLHGARPHQLHAVHEAGGGAMLVQVVERGTPAAQRLAATLLGQLAALGPQAAGDMMAHSQAVPALLRALAAAPSTRLKPESVARLQEALLHSLHQLLAAAPDQLLQQLAAADGAAQLLRQLLGSASSKVQALALNLLQALARAE